MIHEKLPIITLLLVALSWEMYLRDPR